MKFSFKKSIIILLSCLFILGVFLSACVESKAVHAKGGAQLWAENCQRCHNTPPPDAFSAVQWKTIGIHMQTRALLTNTERDKIISFLQQ